MGRAQQRLLLLALSIGARVVVLGWLLVQRHVLSPSPETPSMEVLLAPPIFRRPPVEPRDRPPAPPRPHAARSPERAPVQRQEPGLAAPSTAPGPGEAAAPPAVRRALRGLIGCRLADRTDEERQRCDERLAAVEDRIGRKLDLDPRGAFAKETAPYLARRPKNGCKARAGGDADPAGEQGAAVGIGCAWAF